MADFEQSHGDVLVSDSRDRLDVDLIHDFLARRSYWAVGVPRERVVQSIRHSLCLGAYRAGRQVGFARVITDRATFGWLADVFVVEEARGQGIGKALVAATLAHPDLQHLRRLMLATADAHGLYARFGFQPVDHPERFMAIRRQNPYNTPTPPAA
jgi:GNAT superfamily N-acetyltransferase